jgi:hypothetical protein
VAEVHDADFDIAAAFASPLEGGLGISATGNDHAFAHADIFERRKKRLDVTHMELPVVVLAVKRDRDIEPGYLLLTENIDLAQSFGPPSRQSNVLLNVGCRKATAQLVEDVRLVLLPRQLRRWLGVYGQFDLFVIWPRCVA